MGMCIYRCVYIYICIGIYIPIYLYTYIPIYLYTYIPIYLYTYIPIQIASAIYESHAHSDHDDNAGDYDDSDDCPVYIYNTDLPTHVLVWVCTLLLVMLGATIM